MRREPRAFLWDARGAADAILQFTRGKSEAEFIGDHLLRSAVERQFEIIGEALGQLAKSAPDLAQQISDLPRIVAFRNILIHGYAVIDPALVWRVVCESLPGLRAQLDALLASGKP